MKQIIEDLYPMDRQLLGAGYDSALEYIGKLIDLDVHAYPSGYQAGSWTVPPEWIIRDAWVKFNGEKILDYNKENLSVVQYSLPFSGTVSLNELKEHLHIHEHRPDDFLYEFKFYERDWGFCIPEGKLKELEEGDYEVFIDAEDVAGTMKVGVHTIKGKTDREVLLFAHLDHPRQANDNLSAVACLIDMVNKVKPEAYDHTIKLIFCPETIGSIAYASSNDISKVDFVIALDIVGNKHEEGILLQHTMHKDTRLDDAAKLALRGMGHGFRQAGFRNVIGSDEYYFNDPQIGIPAILLTTAPYPEYHTSADTPDIIDYGQIEKVQYAVIKTIEYYENDYVPEKKVKGPLFRSKYGIQTRGKQLNLSWDYLWYSMDGKKSLTELCVDFGMNYEHTREFTEILANDGVIGRRPLAGEGTFNQATRKKH